MQSQTPIYYSGRIKHSKKDTTGVAPLKDNHSILHNSDKDKAELSAAYFLPQHHYHPHGPNQLLMQDINITVNGVEILLSRLKPHKAMGPDEISPRVLKETATEAATIRYQHFSKITQRR